MNIKCNSEAKGRPKDVPGAILTREKTEEWTVKQLQRWLLCCGPKQPERKRSQLVQRQVRAVREASEVIFA